MSARRLSIDSKMTLQSLGNPGGGGGRAGTHPAAAPTTPVAPADPLAPAGLGDHDVAAWAAGPAAAELGVTGEPTGGGGSFEQGAASQIERATRSSQRASERANVGTNRGTPDGGWSGVDRDPELFAELEVRL